MSKEQWVDVIPAESLKPGQRHCCDVDDKRVLLTNISGTVYAVESLCTHAYFELDDAPIEGSKIVCPLHGAAFCLKTGEVLAPPAFEPLPTFDVRIVEGCIQVKVQED